MILERYLIRNYIGPFFFSMSVITFVFIMDFILRYIDLFLGKGVQFHIVLQTFVLSLGHMFALIIPMAVLPATLMTFGNLASENEITAMKASGVSMYRMVMPGVLVAALLALGLVWYNNFVLPESNHRLLNLLIDIQRKKPTVELREHHFIDDLSGYTIYFKGKNDRTGDITDVQIFRHGEKKGMLPTTITARSGKLKFVESQNVLKVDLFDGEIHELPVARDRGMYRRTRFKEYTLNIKDVDRSLQRTERHYRGDREMSVSMMQDKIAEIRADIELARVRQIDVANARLTSTFDLLKPDHRDRLFGRSDSTAAGRTRSRPAAVRAVGGSAARPSITARNEYITRQEIETQINKRKSYVRQILRYQVEINKKYSIPFACVIFVLVGSPLAIRMGRTGMNMAIGLSILFFLVYYVCLIGGEKLADRGLLSPFAAMWTPNIFFGIIAWALLRKAAREQSVTEWTLIDVLKGLVRRNASPNPR